jgi:excisionase family DNA binding protein
MRPEHRSLASSATATNGAVQLMTPEQCAEFLQVEVNTLYVMKSQGRIPFRKVGNRLRFDLGEIIEWTKAGRKPQSS